MRRVLLIACAGLAIGALIWGLRSRPTEREAVIEPPDGTCQLSFENQPPRQADVKAGELTDCGEW